MAKYTQEERLEAAYAMESGWCPWCHGEGDLGYGTFSCGCNVCGGTGRMVPYRVDIGVRCATCEHFRRFKTPPLPKRFCALTGSPLWSPWIFHYCPGWRLNMALGGTVFVSDSKLTIESSSQIIEINTTYPFA